MSAKATRKTLLVTHYFPGHGGGVEIVAGQLAKRMARAGIAIEWFASATDEAPDYPGVECRPQAAVNVFERRLGVPFPLWSPLAFVRLAKAVGRADVVHIHDAVYLANFLAAVFAFARGKRVVVTQHVGFIPYRSTVLRGLLVTANHIVGRLVLRRAHSTIFVSPVVRKYFESLAGHSPRFIDIPNGVDSSLFSPEAGDRERVRHSLGLGADVPMLFFVGRFVEKKGLQLIHELASRTPEWQWCLAGEGPIDPLSWRLGNVHVLGRLTQTELASYYQAADALVLPSFGEGFPLVVQEALSAGLPVAVHTETRDAGALTASVCVSESVHGADATGRWIGALRALLSSPPEELQARRVACREFALEHWSWDATCSRYEGVLFDGERRDADRKR